jgi:hypothetical protein
MCGLVPLSLPFALPLPDGSLAGLVDTGIEWPLRTDSRSSGIIGSPVTPGLCAGEPFEPFCEAWSAGRGGGGSALT